MLLCMYVFSNLSFFLISCLFGLWATCHMKICVFCATCVSKYSYMCECKCVCVHACMCVCVYVCTYVCVYVYMYLTMFVSMHVCMFVCVFVCLYACTHVWISCLFLFFLGRLII